MMFYRACRSFARFVLTFLFGLRSYRSKNVPAEGGVILASNHSSFLDPPIICCGLYHRPIGFLARSTLLVGVFGALLKALQTVPIERGGSDRGALKGIVRALKAGQVILIFPEGTRTSDGSVGRCKAGAVLAARMARVPIVPVGVDGAFEAWPRQKRMFRIFRPVRVLYGRPVRYASGMARRDIEADLRGRIVGLLEELRSGSVTRKPQSPERSSVDRG